MSLLSSKIAIKTMVTVCRQLSGSYNAGIPITRCLELVAEQAGDRQAARVLQSMASDIRNGASLSEAARRQNGRLPGFFIELLAAGEAGGRLDVILKDLADYYEDRLAIRRTIIGAAIYPAVQLTAAWFLGTFALRAVGRIGKGLNMGPFLREYAAFQLRSLSVAALVVVVCVILSKLGAFKWISGLFTTFVWPVSAVTKRFALARFFRSMSLLLAGGLPVIETIERSAAVTGNPYIAKDMLKTVPFIKEGSSLSQAFAGSRYMTPTAREMLIVGEESGDLDGSLQKVAEYHLNEASQSVKVAAVAGGVVVALGVAAVVGYIVITFYGRLYGGLLNDLGI